MSLTPHNAAPFGAFANTVLMPGDPLRSKFIAENFFDSPELVNNVRGVQGYTGYYHGKRVSVMASGMGMPAIGIYSQELFQFYNVTSVIRIGSCGSMDKDLHIRDLIIAQGACTDSNYADQYQLPGTYCPIASYRLLRAAADEAESRKLHYKVGNVLSSDHFYNDAQSTLDWAKMGVLGVEMEAAALYCNAARLKKDALCILTVSDSLVGGEPETSPEERERTFTDMVEIALTIAD